jgi:membrane fusion protein, multidrug efflux system
MKLLSFFRTHLNLLLLLATVCLIGCGHKAEEKKSGENNSMQAPPPVLVTTSRVGLKTWHNPIFAVGTAQARESVSITAKVSEQVARVHFSDGDRVRAGQLLVELSGRVEQADLAAAQAQLRETEQQLVRQRDLVAKKLFNPAALDAQIALREAAAARVNAVRARLSDRQITAPFAGVLGLRKISPGTMLSPGVLITTLDDVSTIKLEFAVAETDLAGLEIGTNLTAQASALPGREFGGRIQAIDSRIDTNTRSLMIRASLPNEDGALMPGMLLNVQIQTEPREALTVPEIAVIGIGETHRVFIVQNNQVKETQIKIGARREGEVEVLEGLSNDAEIVRDGVVKLRDGASVKIKPE